MRHPGIFAAAAALALFAGGCGATPRVTPNSVAVIVSLHGAGTKSGLPILPGDGVEVGETLIADEGSAMVVKIKNAAAVEMKNSSKLIFETVGDTIQLSLDYGSMLTTVRPAEAGGPRLFVLATPSATVGVRGTTFYTESRAIDQTYMCLCDGAIDVETRTDTGNMRTTPGKHMAVTIAPDFAGAFKLTPAKMMGHTDADISALQKILFSGN